MSIDRETIIDLFNKIRPQTSGNRRAPHKPLLILYAIGKLRRDGTRMHPYAEIKEALGRLLQEYGPSQTKSGTQDPFWRLQKNGVWHVTNTDNITEDRSGNVKPRELLEYNVSGGFLEAIIEQLQNDPTLYIEITQMMLDKAFPESIHSEVLQAVDIELPLQAFDTRTQASNFRTNVLIAYAYKCAVCGFDVKLGPLPIALEASHIKWKSYGGPMKQEMGWLSV